MVDELKNKDRAIYQCELCGFGYEDLETAELCEEFCDSHGRCSSKITRRAVYKPSVQVISVAA
jgi:hypothetical protein